MPRIYIWFLALCALLTALSGCHAPPASTPSSVPYMITVNQAAVRLGMQVSFTNGRYVELTNASNRVLIFTHPGGNVFVNGKNIGLAGVVQRPGGQIYISELLIPRIRSHLAAYTPQPQPGYTPPVVRPIGRTVVIDAGHGGKDPGATSYLGYYEKEVNLKVAQKIAWRLKNEGVQVILTRNNDTFIELNDRADIANRARADLFVSIHHNSHNSRVHRGYTIYIAPNASDASRRAGRLIERALASTGLSSNGMRTNDFRVLMRTQGPAVLVECGYLSNPSEAAILYDGDFQNQLAGAIAQAILQAL